MIELPSNLTPEMCDAIARDLYGHNHDTATLPDIGWFNRFYQALKPVLEDSIAQPQLKLEP